MAPARHPAAGSRAPRRAAVADRAENARHPGAAHVVQLRIVLAGVDPPIWRRVQVPSTITLRRLHDVIQAAMGWTDSHLHQFEIGARRYGMTEPEVDPPPDLLDDRKVAMVSVAPAIGASFRYEYDFGDGWEHDVIVEDIRPAGAAYAHALCLDGARACPPEDCGGPDRYAGTLLPAVSAPRPSPDQRELIEWVGRGFDPETFDLDAANRRLRRVRL